MPEPSGGRYIPVRTSQIKHYRKVALYRRSGENGCSLYKPPGKSLADMRISERRHPALYLYIRRTDRVDAVREIQKGFNGDIEEGIRSERMERVKQG